MEYEAEALDDSEVLGAGADIDDQGSFVALVVFVYDDTADASRNVEPFKRIIKSETSLSGEAWANTSPTRRSGPTVEL